MTPLESFIDWFADLPLKYRQDLVSEIGTYLPGVDVNPFHRKFLDQFFDQLRAIGTKGVKAEFGLLVCIKSLVNQIVRMHLALNESEEWKKERAELEEMAKLTGSCSLAEHASAKALHVTQWQMIADAWQQLCEEKLSDQTIDKAYPIEIG